MPDLAALEYFHFLRPWWVLAVLPFLVMARVMRGRVQSRDMFGGIIAPHLLEHLRLDRFQSRWINPTSLGVFVGALFVIIAMGPSWRQQPSPLSQDESALVVLLDVSSSMKQQDIQPSRLERAKHKVADLLAVRPDKRSALVVYAGTAHTVLPLTADQDILKQYLSSLKPSMMPRPGKFPEYALPLVDDILRDTTAPASVVLFSDGLGGGSTEAFAEFFSTRPHQLLVAGVGTESDEEGLVPLERRSLEQLADATGGHYVSLTLDDSDVRSMQRRIDSHFVVVDDDALPWLDSGYPLVFVCLGVFLLWFRKGWTISYAWILAPIILSATPQPSIAQEETAPAPGLGLSQWFAQLWLTPDQQGRLLMQMGRYNEAASHFDDPMWKGMAYYYGENFMQAAEYFSRSDSDDALFNEANARAHARDYLRAVHRYSRLLERTPDYPGAAANRDKVQAIIDEINRISESQQQEAGVSTEEKQMGGDDAIPAEGAEELSWDEVEVKQFTAEEILQSDATRDMWLRGVQQDPSNFLATKFNMQLLRREAE
jgi:Ca-activated chloride channel homolog